jgi:riboflavin synthase
MFTGIVQAKGRIVTAGAGPDGLRLAVEPGALDVTDIGIGDSVAVNGCCLTVVEKGEGWFAVEVSGETLALTTLGQWEEGHRVNLERAARLGDEMGGHVVSGHVDGVGEVLSITPEGGSHRYRIRAPRPLHRLIAPKGSISVEGVSLTVNEVEDDVFGLNIIPHTWDVTTFADLAEGQAVNIEIDTLARYLQRMRDVLGG